MQKKETLRKLKITLEGMKGLREDEFRYDAMITEFDFVHNCGTVCCVGGFMPRFFPDDFRYIVPMVNFLNLLEVESTNESWQNEEFLDQLGNFYGLGSRLIHTLFYGDNLKVNEETVISNHMKKSLSEVIALWEKATELIENDVIEVEYITNNH